MSSKTQQLQIRVTPGQKAALKRLARDAGQSVSSYVLERILPPGAERFREILDRLRSSRGSADEDSRFVLAELNDVLSALGAEELGPATREADLSALSPFLANYVSAMTEQAATRAGVRPPAWTRAVPPLDEPYFATDLASLRPHLLRESPVPYRRRNLFVDSSVGDRV
jgi:uncharacterized protein (DUF1778 family)